MLTCHPLTPFHRRPRSTVLHRHRRRKEASNPPSSLCTILAMHTLPPTGVPVPPVLPSIDHIPVGYLANDQARYAIFDAFVFEPCGAVNAADGSSAFIKQCFWCRKGGRPCVFSSDGDQLCHPCRYRRRACGPDALGEYCAVLDQSTVPPSVPLTSHPLNWDSSLVSHPLPHTHDMSSLDCIPFICRSNIRPGLRYSCASTPSGARKPTIGGVRPHVGQSKRPPRRHKGPTGG